MTDNISFDIQMQIIKKVYHVKSLIQFRSVSKAWKSFIDSSDFVKGYGARHTQPRSFILSYKVVDNKYICLADDDKETFKVQQELLAPSVVSPLLQEFNVSEIVGTSHGLVCLYGYNKVYHHKLMIVIWNPSISKSFGIVVPQSLSELVYGFGVCPVTSDPTVVKVLCAADTPCHVEVFTLSSGVWYVIPSDNLPRQIIRLNPTTKTATDRFIYWGAWEKTFDDDGEATINPKVVSFDLITKEFKVVNLPNSLTNKLLSLDVSVSKLRGSLVVYGYIKVEGVGCCGVWVMEHDSSFRQLFTIGAISVDKILWFKKNGETIFETRQAEWGRYSTLNVYDPCSQQIKNLRISGVEGSFFMASYKESLLLLDQSDLHIHSDHRMITTTFQGLDLQS